MGIAKKKYFECEHRPPPVIKDDPIAQNFQLSVFFKKLCFVSFCSYMIEADVNGIEVSQETNSQ